MLMTITKWLRDVNDTTDVCDFNKGKSNNDNGNDCDNGTTTNNH